MPDCKTCAGNGEIITDWDRYLAGESAEPDVIDECPDCDGTGKDTRWHVAPATDLEAAISEFKAALPGWWYSVCECQVSCDASCAPTVESEHVHLIREAGDPFDAGFHADLPQPSSLAQALRDVMRQALAAIDERIKN